MAEEEPIGWAIAVVAVTRAGVQQPSRLAFEAQRSGEQRGRLIAIYG